MGLSFSTRVSSKYIFMELKRFSDWWNDFQTFLALILLLQWSYLLAASLVIGGTLWSYFQTPSIRQATYAPVILIGFGMSVMYVMALAFITELIGENKVCDIG